MTIVTTKPNAIFWIVSSIALLWNLMGVNQYLLMAFKSDSVRLGLSAEKLALIDATPTWATAAFATAVFAGALGSLSLLFKKKIALNLFIISLFGILVQNIDGFIRFELSEFSSAELAMTIMIPLFGFFLIWYSKQSIAKGWIK